MMWTFILSNIHLLIYDAFVLFIYLLLISFIFGTPRPMQPLRLFHNQPPIPDRRYTQRPPWQIKVFCLHLLLMWVSDILRKTRCSRLVIKKIHVCSYSDTTSFRITLKIVYILSKYCSVIRLTCYFFII